MSAKPEEDELVSLLEDASLSAREELVRKKEIELAAQDQQSASVIDGFRTEFSYLTIQIPPSMRKTLRERLVKRGFDPAIEQPLPQHRSIIIGELKKAADRYKAKRASAKEARAAKTAAAKEARNAASAAAGGYVAAAQEISVVEAD